MMMDPDFYEQYGKALYGNFTANHPGYRFYDRMMEVDENCKILCCVNCMVVNHVKGSKIKLAGDGTGKTCHKIQITQKFDNTKELYTVHVIIGYKVIYKNLLCCCNCKFSTKV